MTEESQSRDEETAAPASRLSGAIADGRLQAAVIVNLLLWAVLLIVLDASWTVAGLGLLGTFAGLIMALSEAAPNDVPVRVIERASLRPWPDTGMKLVIDALDEPVFITDAEGTVRYQNAAAARQFGGARVGDPLSFKLRVPDVLKALEAAGNGAEPKPVRFVDRGPPERHFAARCAPVRRPRHDGRERPDFVLVRLREETEMVRLDRMRGDFIANASHELRTPLASLTGFVETLLGPARRDEVNRDRFLRIMLEQTQRMGRLIDDLLSLSRVEMKAHMRPTTRVNLAELLPAVADLLAPVARARETTLVATTGAAAAIVLGDRDELMQVLINLVENAVKYGRTGGRVELTLARRIGDDGRPGWLLSVNDDGPGIAPEHLPRLTERFYRVDAARSREQKGTGLGLAIVKHIVNRHHGRLQFRSALGEGTTASVWLEEPEPVSGRL